MHAWTSTWVSLVSMLLYTVSNASLRHLENLHAPIDWCIAVKEAIAVVVLAPWILFRLCHGRYRFQSNRLFLLLIGASLICEVIGAQYQLLSYAFVGLVVAVPALQSSQLISTALLGSRVLGDKITRSKWIAMGFLLGAVFLLSYGKSTAPSDGPAVASVGSGSFVSLKGIGAAALAGIAYSIYFNALRYLLRKNRDRSLGAWETIKVYDWVGHDFATFQQAPPNTQGEKVVVKRTYSPFPITLLMITVTGVGTLYFGTSIAITRGPGGFVDVPTVCWPWILVAGLANVTGFFFQVQGLVLASAAKVALIAAFQIVIFAFLGILFFGETMNPLIAIGVVLAIVGVLFSSQDAE